MKNIHVKNALSKLSNSSLKLTRQRQELIDLLFLNGNAHFTAEDVHQMIIEKKKNISLATIYNCLNQFTKAGILKTVKTAYDKIYFDTNTDPHHHFFHKANNKLEDIEINKIGISKLPKIPNKKAVKSIEVLITLEDKG